MRVALVHDWLVVSGGAEKVTRELLKLYDCDVFALVDHLNPEDRAFILNGKHAHTSLVQHLPFSATQFRYYLPFFPMAMERLDLSAYDLIISASYAVAKGVRRLKGQTHVCYNHTPMRYAWVNEQDYLDDHRMHGLRRWFVRRQLKKLREWDLRSNIGVDRFIANSQNVADRVKKYYGREADVVLPPVDPAIFISGHGPRTFHLAAGRMVPYKRIDRIVQAFASLPEQQLLVAGDGPERARWERDAPANVIFTGHLDQQRLVELMQQARSMICAADEDLGLTPLEAQACGTPVIALRKGGYLETVRNGVNGIFFDEASPATIANAVRRFEAEGVTTCAEELREGVRPYFSDRFREKVKSIIEDTLSHASR